MKKKKAVSSNSTQKQLGRKLHQSHECMPASQEGAITGIHEWDVVSGWVRWDDRVREIWGVDADTPIDYSVFISGLHPDDRDAAQRAVDRACDPSGDGTYFAEYRVINRKNGLERWVAATGKVFFTDGLPSRLIGAVHDITDQKRTEAALRESERNYRHLFSSMSQGFLLVEPVYDDLGVPVSFRYLDANPALTDLTGLLPEEVIGKDSRDVLPGIERPWIEAFARVAKTGRPERMEQFSRDLNRWYEVSIYRPETGKAAMTYTNVSAHKAAEEKLQQNKARLNWVLEKTGIGLWMNNMPLAELTWDRQTRRLFFISDDEVPTIDLFVSRLHPEDREPSRLALEKAAREGTLFEMDHRAVNPETGEVRWIHSAGQVIYNPDGTPMVFDGLNYDITGRKRMESELRQYQSELESRVRERTADLSQAVEALADEIRLRMAAEQHLRERSDQLRSLTSELTLAEQRERMRLAHILHDGLQQILVGAKYRLVAAERSPNLGNDLAAISGLLDDAIETSRSLTSELSPPILREGGLVPAFEWLVRWMQSKHGLNVGLTVRGEIDPASEEAVLMLFQAVRELLFNVVKHAFTRKVSLELTRTNDQIQVVVEDNGVGFDPKEIRGEQGYSGGFGLFSIRERISLLGGRMEIDSASGRGARFKLTIPVSPGTADSGWLSKTKIATPPVISLHHRLEILGAEGSIRIVVVDDHMIMRQGLAGLLRAETDFEIVGEASDGVSALNLIREIKPDVVLMDISMPGMSGIEATRLIHKEMPDIHIIGLSMFEEGDQAAAMREAGAADYLTKSGPAEKLISSIRAGFHRSQEAIQGRQDA